MVNTRTNTNLVLQVANREFGIQDPHNLDAEPGSRPWYNRILCVGLGYDSLRDWQLDRKIIIICNGGDVICIIATGAGKSALIQGPVLALKAMGKVAVGIVIIPTKGLADDQVCTM